MKKIFLTREKVALVDDEDFEKLNKYKWHTMTGGNTFYARRVLLVINGKQQMTYIHWEVLGGRPIKGYVADHVNGNGLDNRRKNLRYVTCRQNCQNFANIVKTSQFPGVSWQKDRNKWIAKIRIHDKHKNLGRFDSEVDAFNAYQQAVEGLGQVVVGYY